MHCALAGRSTCRLKADFEVMFHVKQYRMDYHLHTVHSFDGNQTMDELCSRMVSLGVDEIALTEHIEPGQPLPEADVPPVWDVWHRELAQMRQKYPQLIIRSGVEIGDNPLCRERIGQLLREADADFHLLSLHLVGGLDPYDGLYYEGKTRAQAYREYAEAKAASILSWDDFDSIAHIGYCAKYGPYTGEEKPLRYEDAPDAFDAIFRHVIDLGKCIELNTSGWTKMPDPIPHPSLIKRYIDLGGDTFTFGSDSHDVERDYEGIERAKELVKSLGGKWQAGFEKHRMVRYAL